MKKLKLPPMLKSIVRIYLEHHVSRSSAALSYFMTLSVFPLLICVGYILGYFDFNLSGIVSLLTGFLPKSTLETLIDYLKYVSENQSVSLLIGGLILLVTSSSAAYRSLSATMAEIQGKPLFSGLFGAIFSFLFSLIFLAVIYLSIFVIVSGRWLLDFLDERLGLHSLLQSWQWFRFVLLFLVLFLIISLIFRLATPRDNPRRPILRGAALTTVLLVAASMLFSTFIGLSARYPLVYGSLASLIVLMVWIYICGNVLIVGNAINYLFYLKKLTKLEYREIEIGEENENESQ